MRLRYLSVWGALILIYCTTAFSVSAQSIGEVPPELDRWRSWVLHGHETELCPSRFDDGALTRCQWPSRLKLEILDDGARFELWWQVFSPGWAPLPGGGDLWPVGVTLDGDPVVVVEQHRLPAVFISMGEHRIQGRFFWTQPPETIGLPPGLGLLTLIRNGEPMALPERVEPDKLWLGRTENKPTRENQAAIKIFRLLRDTIPMQVLTLFQIDVSGQSRELELAGALLSGSIPISLESRLPTRLDDEGRLTVQVSPGRWEIRVLARLNGQRFSIEAGALPYGDEIWAFEPQHQLRMVEVLDVAPVEPSQTEIPVAWQQFSVYTLTIGDVLRVKEIRRGNPDPAPDQLDLRRTWWLDFNGAGFTLHDRITGTLQRQWYLAVNPPMALGRVAVNGRDQVITAREAEKKAGVELRTGRLDLSADSRLNETDRYLNVVGWDHDFEHVSGRLHLPPGWRLLATTGIDQVSDTWLQSWSLLDLFLVLIIVLAIFKLRGLRWALVALVLMVLIFKEPGAPRLVWLHLLAVAALLPILPAGWIKRAVMIWGIGALVVLASQAVPFSVNQVRWGFYPQLAPHDTAPEPFAVDRMEMLPEVAEDSLPAPSARQSRTKMLSSRVPAIPPGPTPETAGLMDQDPEALIPTGPGLPQWQWRTIELAWSGPLAKEQTMHLYLLSPRINLILALVRVGLLIALTAGLIKWRRWWTGMRTGVQAFVPIFILTAGLGQLPAAQAQDVFTPGFPPPAMLDELRQRLLEKPDCLSSCADIPRMEISVSADQMQVMLKIHAAVRTAVPLPVNRNTWSPQQVLMDNAPISAMALESDGRLWAVIPAGVHTIVLLGRIDQADRMQLPMYLKPHAVSITAPQWEVRGLMPDGSVANTLQLLRLQTDEAWRQTKASSALVPFFQVERSLRLGLTWQVTTMVRRLTPVDDPAVLSIPLITGESVTTPGIQVDQDRVLIHFAPEQKSYAYTTALPISDRIELTAARAVPWVEIWRLDAASIWQCQIEGIAPIHHLNDAGTWQPQWQPWPGESVSIGISRPPALAGQIKTIDRADLVITPGRRFSSGELSLDFRASQGGPHTFTLPENANLQNVYLDNQVLPVRQEGRFVTIPLPPGPHAVRFQWHRSEPFKPLLTTPAVTIGHEAVNARLTLHMPADRWILFTAGPRWGPAVLFWSYLVVLLMIAVALGRIRFTPLNTWQWLLLAMGLTQIPPLMAIVVVGWLIALGIRREITMPRNGWAFNGIQLILVGLAVAALVCLFEAVKAGLVGQPQMHITGNGSTYLALHWTQDRVNEILPRARVLSLSIWVYRALMLIWSLWLAVSLIKWMQWGWQSLATETLWKKLRIRRKVTSSDTQKNETQS